jgi:hypothetical protein
MKTTSLLVIALCIPVMLGLVAASGHQSGGTSGADLVAKLSAAQKPAVGQPLVIGGKAVCGPKGNPASPAKVQALDNNKNRTDESTTFVTIGWDRMKNLPANEVSKIQGAPVVVTGFLSHKVNVESKESTNCELTQADEVDWHMYLTKTANQPISQALIVEATPRVRPHHKWTTEALDKLVNTNQKVRISGWLLYDFEHLDVVGKERAAVWEVHPITKIEVQTGGKWVEQ